MKLRAGPHSRVVIVGANFAGLIAAQHLSTSRAVTVIDAWPWFEWLPNIHELVSGVKRPEVLRLSRPHLVMRAGHRFLRATVASIDARAGRLLTTNGRRVDFDVCVVAVGGINDTFGVPGADRHAMPFKTVEDCYTIGRQLAALVRQKSRLSVVIVGGGLEGVEALGEVLRRYRSLARLTVHVVEGAPRLLPGAPAAIDAMVRERCASYDVRFHTGTRVSEVTRGWVHLGSGGSLRSDLTVWTGGATASELLLAAELADRPKQWAPVTETLQSRRFENVFVIGDAAALPKPIGKQAYYAMQMGEHAAGSVERLLSGRRPLPFHPSAKPMLISLGDLDTYLVVGKTVIAGPALAAVKESVFELTMAQIDPPLRPSSLMSLAGRATSSIRELLLPALTSWEAVQRLADLRIS